MAENETGYGKRPLWQWVLIYVVGGGVLYAAVYFFFLRGGYSANQTSSNQSNPPTNSIYQPAQPTAAASAATSSSMTTQNVTIIYDSKGFTPKSVTIKAGQTVTWDNKDTDPTQIASDPHPTHTNYPPLNTVGTIQPGQSKSFTFPTAGSYGYHNHIEPTNTGEVIVQ